MTTLDPAAAYGAMLLVRRFEEVALEQHAGGNVPGPLHLALGQEAVAVGACAPLRRSDRIASTHRGHHHCLAKGARPDRLFAEILGRADGYSRGRGGSLHIAIPELGILGTNGVVGGGLPIAAGAAFGLTVQGGDDVVVCFFGEGASSTGAFNEVLNLAALWRLPLVLVCENNQYAELTPQSDHVAGRIWRRAAGYDVPGEEVDGNDVVAVEEAVGAAVGRARRGEGPTLVEAVTYRWSGHYVGDPERYRDPEEVREWVAGRDPLTTVRARLDDAHAVAIEADVEHRIGDALAFALASPPTSSDLLALDHVAA
jgi:TPP-dependent pyruvate/acetoin dehydrogenase alpha subunit